MEELFCNNIEEAKENMEYFSIGHIFNKSTKALEEWNYQVQKDMNILRLKSKEKYSFNCKECGSEYLKSPASIVAQTKNKGKEAGICNFCYGKETNHTNCLFTTHPFTKEAWSNRNTLNPHTIRYTKKSKAWWKCRDCNEEFESVVHNTVLTMLKGNTGCPYCRGFKTNDKNSVEALFPNLIKEWHPTKNKYKLSEVTPSSDKRIHWICEKGHEWNTMVKDRTRERLTKKGEATHSGCPYCANYKVLKGHNDIGTLYPELIPNIVHEEDTWKWSVGSGNKIEWQCTNCNTNIGLKSVKNVVAFGLHCAICSENAPSSERFMASLLKVLNIPFDHNQGFEWSDNRFYDFYLKEQDLIIELHGEQHYHRSATTIFNETRTLEEEQKNDKYKRKLALNNGIKHYTEIPCLKSSFAELKKSIINDSILQSLVSLDNVDWVLVEQYFNKVNSHTGF